MSIADEKHVALTTYRKNGESSATPVWIVDLGDGVVGFTTPGTSLKVKRIRNDPRVVLQPCDMRGRIEEGSPTVSGTATVVTGADFERILAKVNEKYGWQAKMVSLVGKVGAVFGKGSPHDVAIVVTLD